MGLFGRKETARERPAWVPTVDLATARPAIFALANAPASNDARVRSAIADLVRLSGRPPLERAVRLLREDPEVLNRPWIWLTAAMRQAGAAGDHHLAAAGLFWACYWTSVLVPRNKTGDFIELELDPIPGAIKAELLALGIASVRQLPEEFAVVGDDTGLVQAGPLARMAGDVLSGNR